MLGLRPKIMELPSWSIRASTWCPCRGACASRAGGGKSLDLAAFDETDPMGAGLDMSGYKARMSK